MHVLDYGVTDVYWHVYSLKAGTVCYRRSTILVLISFVENDDRREALSATASSYDGNYTTDACFNYYALGSKCFSL